MEAGGWFPTRPPRILFRFGIDRRVSGEEKSLKGIAQIVLLILLKNLHSPSLYNVHGLPPTGKMHIFTTKITVMDTTPTPSHLWSARRGCPGSGCCRGSPAGSPGCCTAGSLPGTAPETFRFTLLVLNLLFIIILLVKVKVELHLSSARS